MKHPGRDPLLLQIAAAIGAGRISIRAIHEDGDRCHGVTLDDGEIAISPIPSTVDTAVHECLHRLFPRWSERTVLAKTTYLLKRMTDAEMEMLYVILQASAKVKKRPLRLRTNRAGVTKELK